MKVKILSLIAALVIICGMNIGKFDSTAKVWADAGSLAQNGTPTNTDLFTDFNANGGLEGINWTDLRHYVMTGINWQCVNLSTGTGTWTSDAVCAK